MEDAKIVELFWQRSEEALTAAEEKYGRFCYKIAYGILANRQDCEECVNDTWMAAWNYIPPKKPAVLSAFLGKITRGFAIDSLRKKCAGKRPDMHMAELTDEVQDLNQSIEQMLDAGIRRQELTDTLNQFLRELPEQKRNIFIQRYWGMMSVKEIADKNHMTETAVKQVLFRSRNILRERLRKEGQWR